jgi:hypothetical protein
MKEHSTTFKKHKYVYNFFLTNEEKDLIFTLKHLYRLNKNLGKDPEKYSEFIDKMTCYYKDILVEYNS